MRFLNSSTTLTLLLATLLSTTTAIITGVTTPSPIYAYNPFTITLTTADYIQSVYDVAVAFGITPSPGLPGSLGTVITTAYLGPAKSNVLGGLTFQGTLPAGTGNGEYVLTASVFSLFGVGDSPSLQEFNTTVEVAGF